ncbi:hypothetical protein ACIA5E_10760 [Nocardia asteroides]|uniref:hypothetical protein n=1 Tax=Nocardia asteroides TaxID=1824 RepID=UPI0037989EAE
MTDTEESEIAAPEQTDESTTAATPSTGRNRATAIVVALAVALGIGGTAAGGYFGWQNHRAGELDRARTEARAAACAYGSVLSTYNATDLDSYFAAVLGRATGAWKQEFESTSADLRDVLIQGQVQSTAASVDCAIATSGTDTAEAIVVVDQSIASVGTQQQARRGQLSITLSLTKSGDRWLTSKVSSPLLGTNR